jgi:HSP20 family protein
MTSLIRYAPRHTLGALQREIDRLLGVVVNEQDEGSELVPTWVPHTDISETNDRYILRMDMPGIPKEAIKVELKDDLLTVSGERKVEYEEDKEDSHRIERIYGHFYRSFTFPQASDPDGVKASLKEGVLTVEVPKREGSQPRTVEIT